jgi:hypothetical protein
MGGGTLCTPQHGYSYLTPAVEDGTEYLVAVQRAIIGGR